MLLDILKWSSFKTQVLVRIQRLMCSSKEWGKISQDKIKLRMNHLKILTKMPIALETILI